MPFLRSFPFPPSSGGEGWDRFRRVAAVFPSDAATCRAVWPIKKWCYASWLLLHRLSCVGFETQESAHGSAGRRWTRSCLFFITFPFYFIFLTDRRFTAVQRVSPSVSCFLQKYNHKFLGIFYFLPTQSTVSTVQIWKISLGQMDFLENICSHQFSSFAINSQLHLSLKLVGRF